MSAPMDLFYEKTHEWLQIDGDIATVGITEFAQNQLSDLTFVELPEVGTDVEAGDELAVLESVKAASDIYAPVAGRIVEINSVLEDKPELINDSPYDLGWLFKLEVVKVEDIDNLMSAEEYDDLCEE